MTLASDQGDKERVFVDVLQATDDYLAACEQLAAVLKGGWFSLARAKYAAASATSLGQAAYPGDMRASAVVGMVEPSDPDDLYDRFELRQEQAERALSGLGASRTGSDGGGERRTPPAAEAGLAGLGGSGAGGGEPATAGCTGADAGGAALKASSSWCTGSAADPLQWFGGGLPPADLRQAQREFKCALVAAVTAANQLQRLRARADVLLDCASGDDGDAGERASSPDGALLRS